jgi:hypothetical protein
VRAIPCLLQLFDDRDDNIIVNAFRIDFRSDATIHRGRRRRVLERSVPAGAHDRFPAVRGRLG